jgi:c-di-GMP-related signal transduction protein
MQLISLYFGKYQNLGLESRTTKKILMDVLKEISKVEIDSKQIKIEKNDIKISVTGAAKSQILINKVKINKEFLKRLEEGGLKTTTKKIN